MEKIEDAHSKQLRAVANRIRTLNNRHYSPFLESAYSSINIAALAYEIELKKRQEIREEEARERENNP